MKIEVKGVRQNPQTRSLQIYLEHPWMSNGELTDVGNRALRILRRHIPTSGMEIHQNELLLQDASSIAPINTHHALQQEFDLYANVPMDLRFSEHVYTYGGEKTELFTSQEAIEAVTQGIAVFLELSVRANLPFTHRDSRLIERRLLVGAQISPEDPCKLTIGVWMHITSSGEFAHQDPWTMADSMRPLIRKMVT